MYKLYFYVWVSAHAQESTKREEKKIEFEAKDDADAKAKADSEWFKVCDQYQKSGHGPTFSRIEKPSGQRLDWPE